MKLSSPMNILLVPVIFLLSCNNVAVLVSAKGPMINKGIGNENGIKTLESRLDHEELIRSRILGENECIDSPLPYLIDGEDDPQDCSTTKREKCNAKVSSHCPRKCDSCLENRCSDTSLDFDVVFNDKEPRLKNCNWVQIKQTDLKCAYPGVKETCRETCAYCYINPSTAPSTKPSHLPSVRPSVVPSRTLSLAPSHSLPCFDSPFKFETLDGVEESCARVQLNKDICTIDGVNSHCPVTCDSCPTERCFDTELRFILTIHGKPTRTKDCEWVQAKQTDLRCTYPGVMKTCRETCKFCTKYSTIPSLAPSVSTSVNPSTQPSFAPSVNPSSLPSSSPSVAPSTAPSTTPSEMLSVSPSTVPSLVPSTLPSVIPSSIPSLGPSASPSDVPSIVPSTAPSSFPSSSPSVFCSDSTFKMKSLMDGDNEYKNKDCAWVKKKKKIRCGFTNVRSHCPVTCEGSCNPCIDSQFEFKFKGQFTNCAKDQVVEKCEISGFFHTCRATCGVCPSLVPSMAPTSMPSISTNPSSVPSVLPSVRPSLAPSGLPSSMPSSVPSKRPSVVPSVSPSTTPSILPSVTPSIGPSVSPSTGPSLVPSTVPSLVPSALPSLKPSAAPSIAPSIAPSSDPSSLPSTSPSTTLSFAPSSIPTALPSTSPSSDPSLAPSSAPSIYCQDSTFRFKTIVDQKDYKSSCQKIKKKDREKVCGYDGVRSHCPYTCVGCQLCVDSSLEFKIVKGFTQCKDTLCSTPGVFHTCRSTCGICKTTVPSGMPSSVPTTLPSIKPSISAHPSISPSVFCSDSSFVFNTKHPKNGVDFNKRDCDWIGQNKKRCEYDNARSHCPVTCDGCNPCSDSGAEFYLIKKNKSSLTNCAALWPTTGCKRAGVFHTCRATCGACPSLVPSIAPSSIN